MANKFLTDLDAASGVSGSDQILLAQDGPIPRRAPVSSLKEALFATGTFARQLLDAASFANLKTLLGLANVSNTSDVDKPVSTATATALAGKAASVHTHGIADVTGLQPALDAKLPVTSFGWGALPGRPTTFPPSAHGHSIADVGGLQLALDGKQATGSYVTTTDFVWASLPGKPATFAPSAHTHAIAEVTGLQAALDAAGALPDQTGQDGKFLSTAAGSPVWVTVSGGGAGGDMFKADNLAGLTDVALARSNLGIDWTTLAGKPATFSPSAHTHAIADVTGLQGALDGKQVAGSYVTAANFTWANLTGKPTSFTPSAHAHEISDVTGLPEALDGKQAAGSYVTTLGFTWGNLTGKPTVFPPSAHTHVIADITGLQAGLDAKANNTLAGITAAQGYPSANRNGDTFQASIGVNGSVFINAGQTDTTTVPLGNGLAAASAGASYKCVSGSNTNLVQHRFNRVVAGSDWTGVAYEILRMVDTSYQHNLRFEPVASGRMWSFRHEGGPGDLLVIDTAGNVTSAGNLTAYSDRSLKDHIRPIVGGLSLVERLDGVRWRWKDGRGKGVGVVAQDVEELFPELVTTDKMTGIKSVAYGNLAGPLIEAVKELAARVRELEGRA